MSTAHPPRESRTETEANLAAGFDALFSTLPQGTGWLDAPFHSLTLTSQFQPIFDVAEQRCYAYEGLLRAHDAAKQPLAPAAVFAEAVGARALLHLDWLCRALHLRNAPNLHAPECLIFINAYPEAAIQDAPHPEVFASMVAYYGLNPQHIVMEILETEVADEALLIKSVAFYRSLGCKVAIDDFGMGASDFDRLWRLRPDFVKIDRAVIIAATKDPQARLVLNNMVRLIRRCGARVVAEGIETQHEAIVAVHAGADYLQGFYFSHAHQAAFPPALAKQIFKRIADAVYAEEAPRTDTHTTLAPYLAALTRAAEEMAAGESFIEAVIPLMMLQGTVRAYVIASEHADVLARNDRVRHIVDLVEDEELARLVLPDSAVSQLNRMVARASLDPNLAHVTTTPPASHEAMTGAQTISYAFLSNGKLVVLGADVLAEGRVSAPTSENGDSDTLPDTSNTIPLFRR